MTLEVSAVNSIVMEKGENVRQPAPKAAKSNVIDLWPLCRKAEFEDVKAYHVGAWLDQHPGSKSTQRQHLSAVRLLFAHLMMRGVSLN